MDSVMMTPTMKDAAMMVVTVVELASAQNTVQNVCAMMEGNQYWTFHVSDLFDSIQRIIITFYCNHI